MTEISLATLALLIEGLALSVLGLVVWTIVSIRRGMRDRKAVNKLIEQVKHQSQTRMESTGSFLHEKYHFEGEELEKAVKWIDKAERRFMQKLVNVYLKRDSERLVSLDAAMAEMVDAYKSLSPVATEASGDKAQLESELEDLRGTNASLKEELSITKETMANMISEFGDMFGGGKDHNIDQEEVVEKVVSKKDDSSNEDQFTQNAVPNPPSVPSSEPITETVDEEHAEIIPDPSAANTGEVSQPATEVAGETEDDDIVLSTNDDEDIEDDQDSELLDEDVLTDDGVEELLNGIDLSEEPKK